MACCSQGGMREIIYYRLRVSQIGINNKFVNHTISHIEIPAPDLERAIAFYANIFMWKVQIMEVGKYAFFRIGDTTSGAASMQPYYLRAKRQECRSWLT